MAVKPKRGGRPGIQAEWSPSPRRSDHAPNERAAIGNGGPDGILQRPRADSVPTMSRVRRAQMWVSTFSMKLRVRVSRAPPKMVPGGPSSTIAPASMNTTLSATL
jgi:hypothetical protein